MSSSKSRIIVSVAVIAAIVLIGIIAFFLGGSSDPSAITTPSASMPPKIQTPKAAASQATSGVMGPKSHPGASSPLRPALVTRTPPSPELVAGANKNLGIMGLMVFFLVFGGLYYARFVSSGLVVRPKPGFAILSSVFGFMPTYFKTTISIATIVVTLVLIQLFIGISHAFEKLHFHGSNLFSLLYNFIAGTPVHLLEGMKILANFETLIKNANAAKIDGTTKANLLSSLNGLKMTMFKLKTTGFETYSAANKFNETFKVFEELVDSIGKTKFGELMEKEFSDFKPIMIELKIDGLKNQIDQLSNDNFKSAKDGLETNFTTLEADVNTLEDATWPQEKARLKIKLKNIIKTIIEREMGVFVDIVDSLGSTVTKEQKVELKGLLTDIKPNINNLIMIAEKIVPFLVTVDSKISLIDDEKTKLEGLLTDIKKDVIIVINMEFKECLTKLQDDVASASKLQSNGSVPIGVKQELIKKYEFLAERVSKIGQTSTFKVAEMAALNTKITDLKINEPDLDVYLTSLINDIASAKPSDESELLDVKAKLTKRREFLEAEVVRINKKSDFDSKGMSTLEAKINGIQINPSS